MTARPDILLANGYFLCEDARERQVMKPFPPLGLLSLSSYLKRRNFGVEVFDGTFQSLGDFARAMDDLRPRAVGITCNLGTKPNVLRMIRDAKRRGVMTILGGPEPANYLDEYLAQGVDCIVMGEGEATLEALLERTRGGDRDDWPSIPGIAFSNESSTTVLTKPRKPIGNLSELPWPDRTALDIPRYLSVWRQHHGYGPVSLICARGCPYRCAWCSHSVFGRTHRRRAPSDVADEVEHIREAYAPDALWFADDVFNIDHRWLLAFRDEMVRRRLTLPFECICRADRMNPKIVEALADLKCRRTWIGAESGSQRILDAMQRGVRIEQVRRAAQMTRDAGIEVGTFIMLGYDGETLQDIEATVDHLRIMAPDIVLTTLAYPIKGTEFYESVADRITSAASWERRTDRDLRINGARRHEFYEMANRWVCAEVERFRPRPQGARRLFSDAKAYARAKWYRHGVRRLARCPESVNGRGAQRPLPSEEGTAHQQVSDRAHDTQASPFDALAHDYDRVFTSTAFGKWLRQRVWERLAEVIAPDCHVLELGGGTGEDACWLAERGARVTMTDQSRPMLSVASAKAADRGLTDRVLTKHLDLNGLPENGALDERFTGVLANFGVVNCVADRRALARWLAGRTETGAKVILTVMGPICPWEHLLLALSNPSRCLRRWRASGVDVRNEAGASIRVRYPSPARLAGEFAPWFEPARLMGLGVLLPPTPWRSLVERRPRLFRVLCRMERAIAHRWPATWLNDHYVLELRRCK